MTALAAAVTPIIRLLVAVATRSGTPIPTCISGTLDPADPQQGAHGPGAGRTHDSATQVAHGVRSPDSGRGRSGAEQARSPAVSGSTWRSSATSRSGREAAPVVRRRRLRLEHRDRDVDEEA